MSRLFGTIRQIAFVVNDLDAAVIHWASSLGVGPFFVRRRVTPAQFRYRGSTSAAPCISVALGNSGGLQIELIQQHDEQPSAWQEQLLRGPAALQHVASWLSPSQYDATYARALSQGAVVVQEGVLPTSGVRFAYFAAGDDGPLFEIADILDSDAQRRMQVIAEAAVNWDGRDPIRVVAAAR